MLLTLKIPFSDFVFVPIPGANHLIFERRLKMIWNNYYIFLKLDRCASVTKVGGVKQAVMRYKLTKGYKMSQ